VTNPRQEIKQLISKNAALPDLPQLLTELSLLEAQTHSSTADMARIISSDQALAAKVLRLVNSPFYGFSREITSIGNALILLGIHVIKSLILSSSIFELLQKTAPGLWRHSLATAVTANIITRQLQLDDSEETTTAALLHDIGKIVIIVYLMDDYENILARSNQMDISSTNIERSLIWTDHAEIGQWLTKKWLLSEKLQEPIACHHDIAQSSQYRIATAVVHYANTLATARGLGFNGNKQVTAICPLARKTLKITHTQMANIIEELENQLDKINNFGLVSEEEDVQ